jgi:hypothetical protein
MNIDLITEISKIKSLIFEQETPPGDDWRPIKKEFVDEKKKKGYIVKQDKKGNYYSSVNVKKTNTTTPNPTQTLPEWINNFTCLKNYKGGKLTPAEKDPNWVREITSNGNTLWYNKEGLFEYVFTNGNVDKGKWECDGDYVKVTMDNGETMVKNKWYYKLEPNTYTFSGDPYQYKVVNNQWHTKSWRQGLKKDIEKWKSLKNNLDATKILDERHPEARKKVNTSTNTQSPTQNQSSATSPGQNTNTGTISPKSDIEIEFGDETDITLPNDTIPNQSKPNRRPNILQSA